MTEQMIDASCRVVAVLGNECVVLKTKFKLKLLVTGNT